MKKILTLLFSLGAFATSFAQYNHQQNNDDRNYRTESRRDDQYANSSADNRNYSTEWRHFSHGNIFSAKERDFQIEKINRDFTFRVEAIQCDRYLRRREKKAAIRNAEIERSRQIQLVNVRFNCRY
ncbi:MAG: hypothetical protein ABI863_22145 [Ginsengibacter sp.]